MVSSLTAMAKTIGIINFEVLQGGSWLPIITDKVEFDPDKTYRLRPDYEETATEQGVVKKDIYFADGKLYFELIDSECSEYACDAPRYKDFIGFLYNVNGQEIVDIQPRIIRHNGNTVSQFDIREYENVNVLTPIAALVKAK